MTTSVAAARVATIGRAARVAKARRWDFADIDD